MIEHKKAFGKAVLTWIGLIALIPLDIYVHKGFYNVFVTLSIIGTICSVIIILSAVAIGYSKTSEEYESKSEADKQIELKRLMADTFGKGFYKKGGMDKVHAEVEQKHLDRFCIWAIVISLVFTGHIVLAFAWLMQLISRSILQCGLENFDDSLIEKI